MMEFLRVLILFDLSGFCTMWKLKIAEGGSPWLRTNNNHVGRQVWEFDPNLGTPEEIEAIERARESYRLNRFKCKHSADLPMRFQVRLINEEPLISLSSACYRKKVVILGVMASEQLNKSLILTLVEKFDDATVHFCSSEAAILF